MVPLIDLSRRMARHSAEFLPIVGEIMAGGNILLGSRTADFETSFAAFAGGKHGVAVSSGASALQLSLAALGIGEGDEVIVPAMTAVPTASSVCAVGARPIFVDVDQNTAAIDVDQVRAALTPRTRAVIVVHLYGRPATDVATLMMLGIPVIEDCAQSHGATFGISGTIAAYSFYPTKNLGGIGDGGMVVTDNDEMVEQLRRLRVHGQSAQYVHVDISQNHRMSEIEAGWLELTLPFLAADNRRRHAIVSRYRAAAPHLTWQSRHENHVYHLAVVRVEDRESFRESLNDRGVATGIHYPLALTQQPALKKFTTRECPQAEAWAAECVSLPCFPELTDTEVETVCDVLARVAK